MKSPKRTSRSRYVILGMLTRGEASGYDIARAIQESTAYFWSESFGQIYPALETLRQEGLVGRREDQTSSRQRTVYSITEGGRQELVNWLSQPYHPTIERNELLLKIFFGGSTEPGIALMHLERAKKEAKAYLALLEQIASCLAAQFPEKKDRIYFEAAVSAGKIGAEAQIAWCEETAAKIKDTFSGLSLG